MKIIIFGYGNIGEAIGKRLNHEILIKRRADPMPEGDLLILTIRPQHLKEAALEIGPDFSKPIVSCLAATPLKTLANFFPKAPLTRMIPNLAIREGKGLMGLSSEKPDPMISDLFQPLGHTVWLPEGQLDPFTVLAGSGMAFIYRIMDAMMESALKLGLNERQSKEILLNTFEGCQAQWGESSGPLGSLVKEIATEGGMTESGLQFYDRNHISKLIIGTYLAAFQKATQMREGAV
jgi:pyrroline-5-carboxylate reductase